MHSSGAGVHITVAASCSCSHYGCSGRRCLARSGGRARHFLASARAIRSSSLSWSAAGSHDSSAGRARGCEHVSSSRGSCAARRQVNRHQIPQLGPLPTRPPAHPSAYPPAKLWMPSFSFSTAILQPGRRAGRPATLYDGLLARSRRSTSQCKSASQPLSCASPLPSQKPPVPPPTCHPRASCQTAPSLCSPVGSEARCSHPAAAHEHAAAAAISQQHAHPTLWQPATPAGLGIQRKSSASTPCRPDHRRNQPLTPLDPPTHRPTHHAWPELVRQRVCGGLQLLQQRRRNGDVVAPAGPEEQAGQHRRGFKIRGWAGIAALRGAGLSTSPWQTALHSSTPSSGAAPLWRQPSPANCHHITPPTTTPSHPPCQLPDLADVAE